WLWVWFGSIGPGAFGECWRRVVVARALMLLGAVKWILPSLLGIFEQVHGRYLFIITTFFSR
ncbi:MAG: hypothetical protein KKA73_20395, partial [Chloroflexi bacterium]|nr:hypothetical protein [Chloroflexota bacterium]